MPIIIIVDNINSANIYIALKNVKQAHRLIGLLQSDNNYGEK